MMELTRRLVLVTCAVVGVWLFFLVDQSPFFYFEAVPRSQKQSQARLRKP